ncbi:MAG: gamma-glutamyltransferase family protein [Gemmatimonadota bacterium]
MIRERTSAAMLLVLTLLGAGSITAIAAQEHEPATSALTSPPAHRPGVPGPNGLVTSGHPLASMAGLRVLMNGGNAADASVAVLSTLHVVRPQMSGMGGNGMFTIYDRDTDQVYALHGAGAAPLAIDADAMTPEDLGSGILAGVVPGLFGAWIAVLDRFGTMSLGDVMADAIRYAEDGHPIEASVVDAIAGARDGFEQHPTSAAVYLPGGRVPEVGEMFRQTDLANTMKRVVEAEQQALASGASREAALQAAFDRFYKGDIAREMASFFEEQGGDFRYEDFARYQPIWAEPVHTTYRGYDVYSNPATSRGGLEVTMQLNLLEGFDIASLGHNTPETLHLIAEAIKVAKADVYHFIGDHAFTDVPYGALLDKDYAAQRRQLIDPSRAIAYPDHGEPRALAGVHHPVPAEVVASRKTFPDESWPGSTTSFSIADRDGNVIAVTPTHGSGFGTRVIVGNTGLFFNNGTRIGSTSPYPDDVNYVRGGQIPILNNSPVLIMRDGEFHATVHSPGGETIGQTQTQVVMNLLDFGMGIQEAVEAPRIGLNAEPNFYLPDAEVTIRAEDRIPPSTLRVLADLGHPVRTVSAFSLGSNSGILRTEAGTLLAGADPRRVDYAVGW